MVKDIYELSVEECVSAISLFFKGETDELNQMLNKESMRCLSNVLTPIKEGNRSIKE